MTEPATPTSEQDVTAQQEAEANFLKGFDNAGPSPDPPAPTPEQTPPPAAPETPDPQATTPAPSPDPAPAPEQTPPATPPASQTPAPTPEPAPDPSVTPPADQTATPPETPPDSTPQKEPTVAELQAEIADLKTVNQELLHRQASDRNRLFGKFGETTKKMNRQAQQLEALTQRLAGTTLDVKDEDFPELHADFPNLSDHIIKGLRRTLGRTPAAPASQPPPAPAPAPTPETPPPTDQTQPPTPAPEPDAGLEAEDDRHLEQAKRDMELVMPGSLEIIASKEYLAWLKAKGPAYENAVGYSRDPFIVKSSIEQYQADTQAQATATPPEPAPADPSAVPARFKKAVQPHGSGGRPPLPHDKTAQELFEEGFAEVG